MIPMILILVNANVPHSYGATNIKLIDMQRSQLTWTQLHASYNLLYILGLLLTFSSVFMINSEFSAGSFRVITLIFHSKIVFKLVNKSPNSVQFCCFFITFLGNILGSLSAAKVANKLGRKVAVLIGCGIFIVGVAIDVVDTFILTFIARFFEGVSGGLTSTIVPYICDA